MNELAYDEGDDFVVEETTYGLETDEDAIFQLYECLFDHKFQLDNPHAYEALRFLIWNKGMNRLYDEMVQLTKEFNELQGEIEWNH